MFLESKLEEVDWHTKRDIIRTLVKRVEIDCEVVNVVFRVKELPSSNGGGNKESLQHCGGRSDATMRPSYIS